MTRIKSTKKEKRFIVLTKSITTITALAFCIVVFTTFTSCNLGKPKFDGTWKSDEGLKFIITKVNDETYDLKAYGPNENIGDKTNNPFNGVFTYNSKTKTIQKITDELSSRGYEISYSDGKLYMGGDKGGSFFTRQ